MNKFLRTHTVSPKLSFFSIPTLYSTLGYDFLRKDFFDDRDRDGFTNRASASQLMFFAESMGYLSLGLQYEFKNTFAPRLIFSRFTSIPRCSCLWSWP